jgi:hypothetical protein
VFRSLDKNLTNDTQTSQKQVTNKEKEGFANFTGFSSGSFQHKLPTKGSRPKNMEEADEKSDRHEKRGSYKNY